LNKTILISVFVLSFAMAQNKIVIELNNSIKVQGEFVGTYMNHIHILIGDSVHYYACNSLSKVLDGYEKPFEFDCSQNTVSADVLFPPSFNPMTGEISQIIPDIFKPSTGESSPVTNKNPFTEDIIKTNKSANQKDDIKDKTENPLTREDVRKIVREEIARQKHQNKTNAPIFNDESFKNNPALFCVVGCGLWLFFSLLMGF